MLVASKKNNVNDESCQEPIKVYQLGKTFELHLLKRKPFQLIFLLFTSKFHPFKQQNVPFPSFFLTHFPFHLSSLKPSIGSPSLSLSILLFLLFSNFQLDAWGYKRAKPKHALLDNKTSQGLSTSACLSLTLQ